MKREAHYNVITAYIQAVSPKTSKFIFSSAKRILSKKFFSQGQLCLLFLKITVFLIRMTIVGFGNTAFERRDSSVVVAATGAYFFV